MRLIQALRRQRKGDFEVDTGSRKTVGRGFEVDTGSKKTEEREF